MVHEWPVPNIMSYSTIAEPRIANADSESDEIAQHAARYAILRFLCRRPKGLVRGARPTRPLLGRDVCEYR